MRIDRWIRVGIAVLSISGALAGEISAASAAPVAKLSRAAINFGWVPGVNMILQPVFVTNTGDAPLTISAMSLVGANPSDFVLGGTCGAQIALAAGGGRCRLDISSSLGPSGGSVRRATLEMTTNASPNTSAVDLVAYYAFEITQGIETTPGWLDFPSQAVGTTSPRQTVTTGSHESIAVTFDRVVLVGGDSSDFALTSDCAAGRRFANGFATCTTTVGFAPTASGPRSTQLEFDFHGSGGTSDKLTYYYSVTGVGGVEAPAGVDLNQHGLTGSWYETATGGQGVEVEVFANPSSGTGSTFVSWFTYDTVSGGAERQRWYTAQGPVVTGQPNAALTIYQNAGGNFNAPPVTNAQAVGTATLSFDTCTSGQLAYTFTDGTGRTGTIPLTRLTQNVTCSTTTSYPTNADFALSGNWFGGAATSGQGFTVEVNPNSGALFAAWYTYMPNGTAAGAAGQRWYTAQAAFTPGLRSMPVTIYETTGGVFDTPTPPGQKTVAVGTGTMAFQSCSAATFSYNFTGGSSSGLSGTINLSRVGPVPPGCTT